MYGCKYVFGIVQGLHVHAWASEPSGPNLDKPPKQQFTLSAMDHACEARGRRMCAGVPARPYPRHLFFLFFFFFVRVFFAVRTEHLPHIAIFKSMTSSTRRAFRPGPRPSGWVGEWASGSSSAMLLERVLVRNNTEKGDKGEKKRFRFVAPLQSGDLAATVATEQRL
jgi:hypothetical protein